MTADEFAARVREAEERLGRKIYLDEQRCRQGAPGTESSSTSKPTATTSCASGAKGGSREPPHPTNAIAQDKATEQADAQAWEGGQASAHAAKRPDR